MIRRFLSLFRKRRLIDEPPLARYVAVASYFTMNSGAMK